MLKSFQCTDSVNLSFLLILNSVEWQKNHMFYSHVWDWQMQAIWRERLKMPITFSYLIKHFEKKIYIMKADPNNYLS